MISLRLTMSREVDPREVFDMVFGTGALSFPWWLEARLLAREATGEDGHNVVETELDPGQDPAVTGLEFIELTHWDKDGDETTPPVKTELTFEQIVEAASAVAASTHNLHPDTLEDLGAADSNDADLILQRAVFPPELWPIFA